MDAHQGSASARQRDAVAASPWGLRHDSLAYRPDIDGLRAISVLAVILFHAEVPGFAGGYVGVDVFFVISGYLITQVLLTRSNRRPLELLRDFYVRRCRRILPALIAMLPVVALLAYCLFLPNGLRRFGLHLAFVSGFGGNVTAWRDGGYFELHEPFSPLLHLWSIAVEEQFYIAFPLLFLASGAALEGRRCAVLVGAGLASFALCVWASYQAPVANFFLAPTRAWELLLGSVVALGVGRSLSSHRARGAFAGLALLAILACVTWYDDSMRYPGLYALVPCVSAAVLLATARDSPSRVGRWLSAKPLVFTGVISYSLYLWHLPVLAFAGYYNIRPLEPWQLAALLLSAYVAAAASWRYVEVPFRARRLLASDSQFLRTAGGATAVLALLGLLFWGFDGLPGRLSEADARLVGTTDRLRQDAADCALRPLNAIEAGSLCRFGPSDGRANVVIWGDSHALALIPEYERIATARNLRVHAATRAACRPLLDGASAAEGMARRRACSDFNRATVAAIEAIDPALVILNAHWLFPDLQIVAANGTDREHGRPPFELALERTLRAIGTKPRKICVIGAVPTLEYVMPYAYSAARRRGMDPAFIASQTAEAELQHRRLEGHLAEVQRRHALVFVNPRDALCNGQACAIVTDDGRSVYRDDNHLSAAGAELLGSSLEACFDGVG